MKLSVALCTYNGEKYILEQLESIINQTKRVDEIIICDDCSTDNTIAIADELLKESGIKYKVHSNTSNLGFVNNFYQAISFCTGDIVFMSDQDDVWYKEKVEVITDCFRRNSNCKVVFSNGYVTNQDLTKNRLINEEKLMEDIDFSCQIKVFRKLLNDNYVVGATMAIKKSFFEEISYTKNDCAHDYWLSLLASLHSGLYFINQPLILYRQHSNNTIGMGRGVSFNVLKRLFDKKRITRDNMYAELRLPILRCLKDYMEKNEISEEYFVELNDSISFWKKRENFAQNNAFKNIKTVFIDSFKHEQRKNRNTSHPILKDMIKAIALSNRDKKKRKEQ